MRRPDACPGCGVLKDCRAKHCRPCAFKAKRERDIKPTSVSSAGYVVRSDGTYEHRFVMEKLLGRKLGRNEHVHHKNGVKTDNRIENLEVLGAADHHREHMTHDVAKRKSRLGHLKRWGYASL